MPLLVVATLYKGGTNMRRLSACLVLLLVLLLVLSSAAEEDTLTDRSIEIIGTDRFISQTKMALSLLETLAPDAYNKVMTYVGVIEQGERSGMWAYEDPPRYEVNDSTAFYSITWYASTIAHDATHSELYHEYLAAYDGEDVPADAWGGVTAERFCLSYQLVVLKKIRGPRHEVKYLASLTGTHCDMDGDGDCDWDDYNSRDW